VVDRHWYNRNKHIFPASHWQVRGAPSTGLRAAAPPPPLAPARTRLHVSLSLSSLSVGRFGPRPRLSSSLSVPQLVCPCAAACWPQVFDEEKAYNPDQKW
jgi:hypothetical protein